jgi:hypothetical protein
MYWCEPKWHDNRKTPADYFILASPQERGMHTMPNAFAACESHLTDAMKVMLDKHTNVTVRRVNRPSKQPGGTV